MIAYILIWVNIGSGNGLLPDHIKPLSETMVTTYNQWVHYHSPETNLKNAEDNKILNEKYKI